MHQTSRPDALAGGGQSAGRWGSFEEGCEAQQGEHFQQTAAGEFRTGHDHLSRTGREG